MQNLRSPLLPAIARVRRTARRPRMSIRMMAVLQREQDLHEIVPDRFFRYGAPGALGGLDDGREVAAAAELHEDVEDALVAVDVPVVVSHDVVVVQVFQYIPVITHPSAHTRKLATT